MAVRGVTSRLYESESDLRAMRAMLMEARSRTSDWQTAHVGELAWEFFMVLCHLDPREHVRLWQAGSKLIGYAILGEDPSISWQILPGFQWRGIEEDALAWAEERLAELRGKEHEKWKGSLVSGARQDDARRIEFLKERGFVFSGEFAEVNMIRSLEETMPEWAIPPGYTVRSVRNPEEIGDRAAAQRDVWRPWTVGDVSDEDYLRFTALPGYDPELDVVALAPSGEIAAYVNGWLDPASGIGDLGPVGARPAYRRHGLTRAVLAECLRRMKARGMDRACVSTTVSNAAATALYTSIGFRIVNEYLDFVKAR